MFAHFVHECANSSPHLKMGASLARKVVKEDRSLIENGLFSLNHQLFASKQLAQFTLHFFGGPNGVRHESEVNQGSGIAITITWMVGYRFEFKVAKLNRFDSLFRCAFL